MNYMLNALMMVWASGAAAAECPNEVPPLEDVLRVDRQVNSFREGDYVPPERVATILHEIGRLEKVFGPPCPHSLTGWLTESRRRATAKLNESLDKDSFVLEGSFKSFERQLGDLERRVASAEAAGWPDGAKGKLAVEYVGYYRTQGGELMRQYLAVFKGMEAAQATDDGELRPWLEERFCAAGQAFVRFTPRVNRLEAKLDMPSPKPILPQIRLPDRRFDPSAGPIFGTLDPAEEARRASQAFR